MPYALQGFITRDPAVSARMAAYGPTADLPQGYVLLPLTTSLLSELGAPFMPFDEADRPGEFVRIDGLGIEFSETGKVAYVEAVDLGGLRYQGAIAWENATIIVPRSTEPGIVDLALNALGATGEKPGRDLFAALKLDRHKSIDDWMADI